MRFGNPGAAGLPDAVRLSHGHVPGGVPPTMSLGGVREYHREGTNGLVGLVGEAHGPYRMPGTTDRYAVGDLGIAGLGEPFRSPGAEKSARVLQGVVLGATPLPRAGLGSSGDVLAEHRPAAGDFRIGRTWPRESDRIRCPPAVRSSLTGQQPFRGVVSADRSARSVVQRNSVIRPTSG